MKPSYCNYRSLTVGPILHQPTRRSLAVNALGYLRVMFTVEDIDDTRARLGKLGAELVGKVVQYEDKYRLCYIRSPKEFSSGWPMNSGSRLSDEHT